MRNRGKTYWDWADRDLHCRVHEERLDDGTLIDVQVRLSKAGAVQMFWGIYGREGSALQERAFLEMPGQTMSGALATGVDEARAFCSKPLSQSVSSKKSRTLPRKGSTQYKGE